MTGTGPPRLVPVVDDDRMTRRLVRDVLDTEARTAGADALLTQPFTPFEPLDLVGLVGPVGELTAP
ncbi:MAG: hypothetical protein KGQ66_22570 [Acidobacteriota bacterium]|nr:hypothetical protein [Acidobacteriota bacterium]